MTYTCTHTHPSTGHRCSRPARADWTTCGQHLDAGQPVVYHDRTRGKQQVSRRRPAGRRSSAKRYTVVA